MFIAALFTITKLGTQPRCPLTNERIKKVWHIYTIDYYYVIKNNQIISFAGKWMEPEIMLNKISQIDKDEYHMLSSISGI
jgi:hypothetical protein